jgi:hypothetical protein
MNSKILTTKQHKGYTIKVQWNQNQSYTVQFGNVTRNVYHTAKNYPKLCGSKMNCPADNVAIPVNDCGIMLETAQNWSRKMHHFQG